MLSQTFHWQTTVYISEVHRDRKPKKSGAISKLCPALSFTRNLNEFPGEIQGTANITCYLKSEILVHYDRIRKAKSLLRAKHAKENEKNKEFVFEKKYTIIKKINFRKTVEYNALNIRTYLLEKNVGLCVKYLIFLHSKSRGFYVRC